MNRARQALAATLAGLLTWLAIVALTRADGRWRADHSGDMPGIAVAGQTDELLREATVARSADRLIAGGEYVYGPLLAGFDTASEVERLGGALAAYSESVGDERLSGAAIVERVAREHSVSPRLLLALLELATGAVTDPGAGDRLAQPFGGALASRGLSASLRAAAAWLDDGFYGLKYRDNTSVHFADGSVETGPVGGGAGHFAVARVLALSCTPAAWSELRGRFADTYRRLFGDIPAAADGMAPGVPQQPPLLLPWPDGERWYFTGGPHGAWGVATAWGAVDFAPPSPVGCGVAPEWVVAAAPGVVTRSERGFVVVDLDGDGFEGSGWVLVYLHMATDGRATVGTRLQAGDRVGHPSCEGGFSTGAHVHLSRRYNGEWLPADGGPAPLDLSGWRFTGGTREYDGAMSRAGDETRNAVTSGHGGRADLVSDNGPTRHAELAAAWRDLTVGKGDLALAAPATAPLPASADARVASPGARTGVAPLAPDAAAASAVATPFSPPGMLGDPPAPVAAQSAPAEQGHGQLIVNLRLTERRSQATPFGVEIVSANGESVAVLGRADGDGRGEAISLPGLPAGLYDITVRVPGFEARTFYRVALADGATVLDLTGDLAPLLAGELTGDGHIDVRDGLAWLGLAARRAPAADVNGDGRVGGADLARVLANRGR